MSQRRGDRLVFEIADGKYARGVFLGDTGSSRVARQGMTITGARGKGVKVVIIYQKNKRKTEAE
jgi:hypothetical protein